MAMLAETKKKQKWSLNPRGSAWMNGKLLQTLILMIPAGIQINFIYLPWSVLNLLIRSVFYRNHKMVLF